ncbi:hypothetical protein P170DRAFT_423221 [Aspergillus steynii IBT 23096]|uniref:Transferase family protein n=1 Tax=Aspergillus steynii IBT 23096 TaxID=1392250 RepID=A0A2I2GHM2_9EURO|nr:uncharacterized protein P170DRAFT_423221 [Aspergillus steynii IBT 23096]PLB52337.1 hypothetical protein P170DRAFT_423221 [Aspergillus steynii IBT 23096]
MDCPTSFESYTLSPLDHLLPNVYMLGFTSFAPQDTHHAVLTLEDAVHWLMQQLPFLGGEVFSTQTCDKANVWAVRPTNRATLKEYPIFRSRTHSQPITFIQNPRVFDNSFSAFPIEFASRESYPLIRFQANIMQDGVILTTSFFHPAMDGKGYFNVLHTLSGFCRGVENPPLFTYPQLETETRKKISEIKSCADTTPGQASYTNEFVEQEVPLVCRKLFLPTERLKRLRDRCQAEGSGKDGAPMRLTLNDIVCAIAWICMVQARSQIQSQATPQSGPISEDTILGTVVDTRASILSEIIHEGYMGNALLFPVITYPVQSMANDKGPQLLDSLSEIARRLHHARQGVNMEYAKSTVVRIQNNSDWGSLWSRASHGVVSSLRFMKVYDWDFGSNLGFINDFEMHDSRLGGRCWIMPARPLEAANWELYLTLEVDAWEHLEKNALFRWVSGEEFAML